MRLILHIGTEKTATTTLQYYLYQNQAVLAEKGVALSEVCGKPNNRWLPGYCQPEDRFDNFLRSFGLRSPADRKEAFADFPDKLKAEIEALDKAGHQAMILTSEHCHSRLNGPATVQKLHDLVTPLFSDVQVICYYREQAAMLKSLYSTSIKSGRSATFPEFIQTCTTDNPRYNYADNADLWSGVFGTEAYTPRLFLKDRFVDGDICADFLATAGLEGEGLSPVAANRNESLGAHGIMLGRIANRYHSRYGQDSGPNPLWRVLSNLIQESDIAQSGRLSFPEAAAIHETFDPINRDFAARYLGEEGNPFPAPGPDSGTAPEPVDPAQLEAFWEAVMAALEGMPMLAPNQAGQIRKIARQIEKGDSLGKPQVRKLRDLANQIKPKGNKGKP